ncbi:RNA-binding S4 domain-containing protein [Frigidibacter sp. SD6-1]|uniref:RNA-binding S4 domain-containing protein n=1 Tax=Frigidibacter sp. SD6-1 TaxID=3032581 RepID=UPI0024E0087D|nr:RNA-binding S4 domain-containing protein [Frigidibacter sp. SD6-1]
MEGRIRLDKWLWQARFLKSRSLAAALIEAGHVRLNGVHVVKPAQAVGPGDVLTFALNREVRVVRVLACGARRGPATEARTLYAEAAGTGGSPDPLPGE